MNIKKVMIALLIGIIILSILLVVLIKSNSENKNITIQNKLTIDNNSLSEKEKIIELKDANTFYVVTSCINKYMAYNTSRNLESLYKLLSEEYINRYSITKDNITGKIKIFENDETFSVTDIYEYNNNDNISTYFVTGKAIEDTYENDNPKEQELKVVVQLDKNNNTFCIILNEDKDNSIVGKSTQINDIKSQGINTYTISNIEKKSFGVLYFNDYINKVQQDINSAYGLLDAEYKNNKFKNVEEFEKYIDSIYNLAYLQAIAIELIEGEEYNIYVCRDQYDNIYIFKETSIMKYTVQLDDYTIKNSELDRSYQGYSKQDKGISNISKFFRIINAKQYDKAYKMLDETFKQNNFSTLSRFEEYMKEHTFAYNKIQYKEYSNEIPSLNIYKIEISDMSGINNNIIRMNIVMQLLEGTDFIMSFSIGQ